MRETCSFSSIAHSCLSFIDLILASTSRDSRSSMMSLTSSLSSTGSSPLAASLADVSPRSSIFSSSISESSLFPPLSLCIRSDVSMCSSPVSVVLPPPQISSPSAGTISSIFKKSSSSSMRISSSMEGTVFSGSIFSSSFAVSTISFSGASPPNPFSLPSTSKLFDFNCWILARRLLTSGETSSSFPSISVV